MVAPLLIGDSFQLEAVRSCEHIDKQIAPRAAKSLFSIDSTFSNMHIEYRVVKRAVSSSCPQSNATPKHHEMYLGQPVWVSCWMRPTEARHEEKAQSATKTKCKQRRFMMNFLMSNAGKQDHKHLAKQLQDSGRTPRQRSPRDLTRRSTSEPVRGCNSGEA